MSQSEAVPSSGGTWIRQPDGSLRQIPEGVSPESFDPSPKTDGHNSYPVDGHVVPAPTAKKTDKE